MWSLLKLFALSLIICCDSAVHYGQNVLSIQMHQHKDYSVLDHLSKPSGSDHKMKHPHSISQAGALMKRKLQLANDNLQIHNLQSSNLKDAQLVELDPGQPAKPFSLPTLQGNLVFPGPVINQSVPILFHAFNPLSGFAQCLWNCSGSVEELIQNSPNDTHYVFMSTSLDAYFDALWMQNRFKAVLMMLTNNKRYFVVLS